MWRPGFMSDLKRQCIVVSSTDVQKRWCLYLTENAYRTAFRLCRWQVACQRVEKKTYDIFRHIRSRQSFVAVFVTSDGRAVDQRRDWVTTGGYSEHLVHRCLGEPPSCPESNTTLPEAFSATEERPQGSSVAAFVLEWLCSFMLTCHWCHHFKPIWMNLRILGSCLVRLRRKDRRRQSACWALRNLRKKICASWSHRNMRLWSNTYAGLPSSDPDEANPFLHCCGAGDSVHSACFATLVKGGRCSRPRTTRFANSTGMQRWKQNVNKNAGNGRFCPGE